MTYSNFKLKNDRIRKCRRLMIIIFALFCLTTVDSYTCIVSHIALSIMNI